jgi:Mn-dependent DtxR family transcriptional regulator
MTGGTRVMWNSTMRIHKSAEDYLEMILRLTEEKGYARSVDIAMGLGVSKPSVSVAMKQLREGGYIVMDKDNYISLTDTGKEIAHRIYERHKVLTRMLTMIGVDEQTAENDACKVEHDISVQTFTALKDQLEKMEAKRQP